MSKIDWQEVVYLVRGAQELDRSTAANVATRKTAWDLARDAAGGQEVILTMAIQYLVAQDRLKHAVDRANRAKA